MTRMKRHEIDFGLQEKAVEILRMAGDGRLVDQLNKMLNPGISVNYANTEETLRLELNCESNGASSVHIVSIGGVVFIDSIQADPRPALIIRRIESCIKSAARHIGSV